MARDIRCGAIGADIRDGESAEDRQHGAPKVGRCLGAKKCRGWGGDAGAGDEEVWPGRVRIYAAERGAVAAQWLGRTHGGGGAFDLVNTSLIKIIVFLIKIAYCPR